MNLEKRIELEEKKMRSNSIVIVNDLHIPFENRKVLDNVYKCISDIKPKKLILLGDLMDFYTVSKFSQDPKREMTLEKEIQAGIQELKTIKKLCPNIIYVKGNHEFRLEKYIIRSAKELSWVEGLKFKNLMELDKLGIRFIDKDFYEYKGILFSHMSRAGKYGAARLIGTEYMKDVVHAHDHKLSLTKLSDKTFISNGCLCELQAEYLSGPSKWSWGFSIIDFDGKEPLYQLIDIGKKGSFFYSGRIYK